MCQLSANFLKLDPKSEIIALTTKELLCSLLILLKNIVSKLASAQEVATKK